MRIYNNIFTMDKKKKQYEISVYKIWYDDAPNDIYIGSTKQKLSLIMSGHICSASTGASSLIYNTMRKKGIHSFKYVILGSYMVSNMDEQMVHEKRYIADLKPSLNVNNYSDEYRKHPKKYTYIKKYQYNTDDDYNDDYNDDYTDDYYRQYRYKKYNAARVF